MAGAWKKLDSKIVHQNPWYKVTDDDVVRPDGSPARYFVVRPKQGAVAVPCLN